MLNRPAAHGLDRHVFLNGIGPVWDGNASFALGNFGSTLLIGVAMGNIAWGVPIDARGEFAGSFLGRLHPYALLMGVTTVALFAMHGAIHLGLETEGDLQACIRARVNGLIIAFIRCHALLTLALIGRPVVLAYSVGIYWIFRGKVQLDKMRS